jgi:hypothetical protein
MRSITRDSYEVLNAGQETAAVGGIEVGGMNVAVYGIVAGGTTADVGGLVTVTGEEGLVAVD